MAKIVKSILILFVVCFSLPALAEERASPEEAQALVKKAVALYKSAGKDKALAAFVDPNGGFMPKDLYIFVQDMKGGMVQHAKNAGLNGKDLSGLKDPDGKAFVAEMVKVAADKGAGWVDYKWTNAQTKKIEQKSSYVERVDDLFIGAGIYKQ